MDIVSGAENIPDGNRLSGAENISDGYCERNREHLCWMDIVSGAEIIRDGSRERSREHSFWMSCVEQRTFLIDLVSGAENICVSWIS